MATGTKDVSAIYELLYNPTYRPRCSPTAHLETLAIDGEPTKILMKESGNEYFEVDAVTETIWRLLDGNRTISEIFNEAKSLDDKLTEKEVRDIVVSLAEEGIIESTEPETQKKRVEIVSAFQVDVQLLRDSSKSLAGLFRLTRKLIKKPELPLSIGIVVFGFALFYASFIRIFTHPSLLAIAGSALLGFFVYQMIVLLPVYAVHELAHAAVCDYYGAKPRAIGTGLYYLAPFFYCDTSDAWRLSRRARIMISVAGPLSTVVISAFLVFWSYLSPPGYLKDVLQIGAFFGFYGSLTNFSPVIETDGYYILADVLNFPNLRDEAFSYIKRTIFKIIGRPVRAVRQSAQHRRIIAIYAVITIVWLAFFGYTTVWIFGIYGVSAYQALSSLLTIILGLRAFDLTTVGVNIATLVYFSLIVAGFVVMGAVAYRNIRMKGVKLETIHDKRVSAFLPLPSDIRRPMATELVASSQKLARKFSRSSTVTLQPPFCVAELRLGKVDQSMEAMWDEMRKVEESFRSLHFAFLGRFLTHRESSPKAEGIKESLYKLARSFPRLERGRAGSAVSQFVTTQDEKIGYLLQAAFGTVWTLEFSPDDYRRLRRGMFPTLIAEDLSVTDLPSAVEDFKKRTVLGLDTLAKLSAEIEAESREVYKRPEVYQTTTFLEPVKSRLVFVGRTDKVEGSVVWLGGLYLYQAWISFIREALDDAALGLKSIRLSRPTSLTKSQAAKLHDSELASLKECLDQMEALIPTVTEALTRIESTFESASNFHESLENLVVDESFDVGLYKPILTANGQHLKGVKEKIEEFTDEFEWVSKRLTASKTEIGEERSERVSKASSSKQNLFRRLQGTFQSLWGDHGEKNHTQVYDTQIKLIFATTRLVYGIVIGSDVIL